MRRTSVSFKMKGHPKDIKTTVNAIKTLTPRFIVRALEKIKKQEKFGGSERNRTAVQGFAGPYITTLPPSLKKKTIITI